MITEELKSAEEIAAREAQRQYNREYYHKNRKRILEQNKKWRSENPDKVEQANRNYWMRKAKENNLV